MVGKSRFGGLFSVLNRRDLNIIRLVEGYFDSQPDYYGDLMSNMEEPIEELSIDELIGWVDTYIINLRYERGIDTTQEKMWPGSTSSFFQEVSDYQKQMSPERKVQWAEGQRQSRYWEVQLRPILAKLEKAKNRLENEELE